MKASRDIALTGADASLSSTGAEGWMDMSGGGVFIFDNTNTGWSSVQLVVGRRYTYGNAQVYCRVESMTKIANTNLYSYTIDNWATSGDDKKIYDIRFVTGSNYNTGNFSPTDSGFLNSCTHYTGVFSNSGSSFNKGDVYHCRAASSTNGAALSIDYRSTGYGYFNYDQTIRSYTKDASHTSYSQVNDGGTISGSSYKLNGNASSTASSEADGKVIAAKTATVTLKATPSSGYRFVGWYDSGNNALSNGVGGYTIGTGSDGKPYISYTCTGAKEIRARFIKTYTVTVQRMSGYTGPAPTGGATVDIGSSVTINANVQTGFNFSGWTISGNYTGGSTSSASTTITPTSNVTATARYSLKAPNNLALSYDAYKILGYSSYTPNTSSAQSQTASGSGSVLSYSYDIAQDSSKTVNLVKGTDYSVNSSGAVSANYPGKYVVTMTVTDTCYGLTSTATTTATVEVKPVTPSFSYTVEGYTSGYVEGVTGTVPGTPYKIPIHSGASFQIASGLTGITDYSYSWTMTDGSATANYIGTQKIDKASDTGTVLHDSPVGDYTYGISLKASYNGVDSVPATATIYYSVIADFLTPEHFNFDNTYDNPDTSEDESDTVQKVYSVDNTVTQAYAGFMAGGEDFDTILYFSSDNKNFTPIQIFTDIPFTLNGLSHSAQPNDAAHRTVRPYTADTDHNYLIFNLPVLAQLANNGSPISDIINVMQRSGVKYFKAYVDDFRNSSVNPAEVTLHTTVGTASTGGSRPLYFKDSSGVTATNMRLMAYFLDSSGAMTYQTAADFNSVVTELDGSRTDRTGISRFYAPSDAVSVYFAYSSTNSYVLPTLSNGALSFGSDKTIFAAHTDLIPLDSGYNMYKVTAATDSGNTPGVFSGTWTNLDMDS